MYTENDISTRNGTFGGTLLVILMQVSWTSLLQTALVAAVGATTSYFITIGWQYVTRRFLRKRKL